MKYFSLNRLYVWVFSWYPYGKLSFGSDFNSSGVISGRSVICNDCEGSFLPRLTEPVRTVRFPRALERISAEEEFGAKPPNKVSCVLSMIVF